MFSVSTNLINKIDLVCLHVLSLVFVNVTWALLMCVHNEISNVQSVLERWGSPGTILMKYLLVVHR